MPHLALSLSPQGPIVDLIVAVSTPRHDALVAANQPIPTPIPCRFLVDTGASHSLVDHSVIASLGLSPTGYAMAHTPSTQGVPMQVPQYDVSLHIPHSAITRSFHAVQIGASGLKVQGFDGLMGRDILAECLLIYSGPEQTFMLSI